MEPIILASGSPRRQEYFRLLGLPFTCIPSPIAEIFDLGAEPGAVAEELARKKIGKVLSILGERPQPSSSSPLWVCGADTLISLEGRIYGKPGNRDEARETLRAFAGRTHEVITAVALYSGRTGKTDCRPVTSKITFAALSPGEIEWYLDTGEWQDAAGAYKIQGKASCFISSIKGSYSSIVGLPLREFYRMLKDNGYPYGG